MRNFRESILLFLGRAGAAYILLVCLCVLAPPTRSEGEIEYQNELGCALEVTCPKGYAMNAVYGKAGYEPVPGSNPPVPIATSYDYEWFWNCEEVRREQIFNTLSLSLTHTHTHTHTLMSLFYNHRLDTGKLRRSIATHTISLTQLH